MQTFARFLSIVTDRDLGICCTLHPVSAFLNQTDNTVNTMLYQLHLLCTEQTRSTQHSTDHQFPQISALATQAKTSQPQWRPPSWYKSTQRSNPAVKIADSRVPGFHFGFTMHQSQNRLKPNKHCCWESAGLPACLIRICCSGFCSWPVWIVSQPSPFTSSSPSSPICDSPPIGQRLWRSKV